ncbi:MAG: ATP-binding cassette domain-containing protein, partial [Bordetella sp.]|nr:ATP-binding cassette domain-containing protein [Bordetella sp.]
MLDGVTKVFPGVRALDDVGFTVRSGEVHGLVGENGAGKSTLMAVASGALVADEGKVLLAGAAVRGNPQHVRELGLAIVRQEPALMPDLSVAENMWLGVPERARPPLGAIVAWATHLLGRWNDQAHIDPRTRVASLGPEERFTVEIVKALAASPR